MQFKTIITSLFISLALTTPALAAEPTPPGCQPLFNGGSVCQNSDVLSINKKVLKPGVSKPGQKFSDSDFIDNIGPNDPAYGPGQVAAFRLYLTNKTKSDLKDITVKDIFPPRFVTYIAGDGKFDNTSHVFQASIATLKAQSTKEITIQVMTANAGDLPTSGSLCTINLALATVNNKTSQDTSQICVARQAGMSAASSETQSTAQAPATTPPQTTKGGLPVASVVSPAPGQNTPETGPETLVLAALLPTGALGWLLRKKTS